MAFDVTYSSVAAVRNDDSEAFCRSPPEALAGLRVEAAALAADRPLLGQRLETFVFRELRRQVSRHDELHAFFRHRDKGGAEVDIVIERRVRLPAGVEVKAAAMVTAADIRSLRKLKDAAGKRFAGGVVRYDSETRASSGDGLFAVPVRSLWDAIPQPGVR